VGALLRQDGAVATEFFFGAMSPYSWLAAERIDTLLPEAVWRPLFLGGLFKGNGRVSWGLTERRDAGLRDCEERAAADGVGPIRWPEPWPTSDLLVARAMVAVEPLRKLKQFALAAMRLSFREGADLGEARAVLEAGERVGVDPGELSSALSDPATKAGLRAATERAASLGVVGVPTVRVEGALFWGDDRLEEAADHARSRLGG
jgi:2-hydroxychromene-2-carboxylate isomerase